LRVCRKQSTQIVRRDDAGPKRQVRGTREHKQRGEKAGPVSAGEQAKHANGQTRPSQEERRASPWSQFGEKDAGKKEQRHEEQGLFHDGSPSAAPPAVRAQDQQAKARAE
jgi:hypothetical protein